MPLEVLLILLAMLLAVGALEVGTVTFDIVEHVLVSAEELGGVGFEQFHELCNLRATEEYRVFTEELARVVERLQLGESLEVADAQLGHVGHGLRGRLCLQQFVELLHLAPCVDAVVIDDGCHLHVRIKQVIPFYFGVLFFFFFGAVGFFD